MMGVGNGKNDRFYSDVWIAINLFSFNLLFQSNWVNNYKLDYKAFKEHLPDHTFKIWGVYIRDLLSSAEAYLVVCLKIFGEESFDASSLQVQYWDCTIIALQDSGISDRTQRYIEKRWEVFLNPKMT